MLRDELSAQSGRRGGAAVGTGEAERCRGGKEMKDGECPPASFLERRYVQAQTLFSLCNSPFIFTPAFCPISSSSLIYLYILLLARSSCSALPRASLLGFLWKRQQSRVLVLAPAVLKKNSPLNTLLEV